MACMYCSRDDNFVKQEGKCILHTSKFSWFEEIDNKRVWNSSYVNAFWKVIREEVMLQTQTHSFQYVIFPAFEKPQIQKSSSSHSRHQMYEAISDFSFWKKGHSLAFDNYVDFSFASFIEPATFANVFFKEADFIQIKAPRISFKESTLQSINFKESKISKMQFINSNLEKIYFDRSKISWLMFNENFIDKLFLRESIVESLYIQRIKEGRNIIINESKISTLEIKELQNSRLSLLNCDLQNTYIENIVTNKLNVNNCKLDSLALHNNRIASLEMKDSSLKDAFNLGTGKVSKLELVNCDFSSESNMWLSDIKIKDLILKDMRGEIPLCSFEKIKVEKSLVVHNSNIRTLYAQDVDFSSSKLVLSFINMQLFNTHLAQVHWGVLKQDRLDCDETSLNTLYKIYQNEGDMNHANLFHHILHQPSELVEEEIKEQKEFEIVSKIQSLVDKAETLSKKISLKKIKTELKAIKQSVPRIKLEVKETKKDMFEVQFSTKKQNDTVEDANAPILKYEPALKESIKELLNTSCEALGCSTLKQFVKLAS